MKQLGTLGGRALTLFSRPGDELQRWTHTPDFYFSWLDYVFGASPAYLIHDSPYIGTFLHKYRRENVVTAQVIHNTHLDEASADAFGAMSRGKLQLIKNLRSFDLVAPLTHRQADELAAAVYAIVSSHGTPYKLGLCDCVPGFRESGSTGRQAPGWNRTEPSGKKAFAAQVPATVGARSH